jgi:uncharacterized protein YbjT (DUF2867 family)
MSAANWFMQNISRGFFLPRIRDVSSLVVPVGKIAFGFVDTRDIAAVAVKALTNSEPHAGQTYVLTEGESLSYRGVAATLVDVLGRRVSHHIAAPEDFREILLSYFEPEHADYIVGLVDQALSGQGTLVDPTLAAVLGRESITFEQFARDNAEAWS